MAIENNRENHPILNQIYDIHTELHNQGKQITLCIVPAQELKETKKQTKLQKNGKVHTTAIGNMRSN